MNEVLDELRETTGAMQALVEEIRSLANGSAPVQTVIHKSSSSGFIAGFAVAACIATLVLTYDNNANLRDKMKELSDKMRDTSAWVDVLRGKVATLEGKSK